MSSWSLCKINTIQGTDIVAIHKSKDTQKLTSNKVDSWFSAQMGSCRRKFSTLIYQSSHRYLHPHPRMSVKISVKLMFLCNQISWWILERPFFEIKMCFCVSKTTITLSRISSMVSSANFSSDSPRWANTISLTCYTVRTSAIAWSTVLKAIFFIKKKRGKLPNWYPNLWVISK